MKKVFLFLLLFFFSSFPVFASDKTLFTVKSITASSGDEVCVSISIQDNPRFELLSLELPIDVSQVDFISCDINGFSSAMMKSCDLNPHNEVVFYALTMYKEENKLLEASGDILDIHLKIHDNVKKDIPLSLKVTSYGKSETESLDYDVVHGMIKIAGNIETKIVDEKTDLSDKVSDKDVVWNSSEGDVASVDENGQVTFHDSGNTTISATDKDGNVLYEKTYLVNKKRKRSFLPFVIFGIGILLLGIIIFIILRIRGKKNEKKENIN